MSRITNRPTTRQQDLHALSAAASRQGLTLRTVRGEHTLTRFGTHLAVELQGSMWALGQSHRIPVGQEALVAEQADLLITQQSAEHREGLAGRRTNL